MKKINPILIILYIVIIGLMPSYSDENPMSIFTEQELEWLENHPVITVAPEDDYGPIEYYENDRYKGLALDYLQWISERYNIEFEYVYYDTWSEILEALKNGDIDMQPAIVKTNDRMKYLQYTDSYIDIPNIVLVQKDFGKRVDIETLFDHRVGVIKDYAVHEYIMLIHSPDGLYEYFAIEDALTDLSLDKLDAVIIDLAQATHYIHEMAIPNLTVLSNVKIDFEYKLRMAVPNDREILASILNKALNQMPESKRQALFDKWISLGYYTWFTPNMLRVAIGLAALIAVIFIVAITWSVSLKRKDVQLHKVNHQLETQIDVLHETQAQLIEVEKINSLSRLVIGVAHEINTPLGNGISASSYIQRMSKQLKKGIEKNEIKKKEAIEATEEIIQSSEVALNSLHKTSSIIDSFKAVANYQYEVDSKELLLDEEIERIIGIISNQQDFHCIINMKLQKDIQVTVPPKSIFQIITPMIGNCCIHAYPNTVGNIDIMLSYVENQVILSIKDYGRGISDEIKQRIFEPFYTSRRGSEHTGLGLYGIHNIVTHILNGSIHVESKPAEGTEFTITFPVNVKQ